MNRLKKLLIFILPIKTIRMLNRWNARFYLLYRITFFLLTKKAPLPSLAFIEPTNKCQLQCPLCPTGSKQLNYPQEIMSLETFRIILNKVPFLKTIAFYNWGESLLHPDAFSMIRYAKQKGMLVNLDTNLCFQKDKSFFHQLIDSGLDILRVSLDGASSETYLSYRNGGNFDLVLNNLKTLIEIQKEKKVKSPKIIWKFLVHRYNEHEVFAAKDMAKRLEIDFDLDFLGLSDDLPDSGFQNDFEKNKKNWLPHSKQLIHPRYTEYNYKQTVCEYLFNSFAVTPEGKIFPCCKLTDSGNYFGDLLKDSFSNIWNNKKYYHSRIFCIKKRQVDKNFCTVCMHCQ